MSSAPAPLSTPDAAPASPETAVAERSTVSDSLVAEPPSADSRYLRLQGLSKRFGATSVFEGIEADIARGEFVTLLGPSGCGKSTLLRAIAGLTAVDAGHVEVDGETITHLPPQKRGIGMVFQHYALFPNMTVFDNVAFGLRMHKVPSAERQQRVDETLSLVELETHAHKHPHQLSGGQRQRVALARSLVLEPRILLMDEPLSALDARIRQHLREQLRNIQQQLGLTTLFVTHDQEEALMMSDRIFLMGKGNILQKGDGEALYTRPESQEVAGFMGAYNCLDAQQASSLLGYEADAAQVVFRPEALYLKSTTDEINDPTMTSHLGPGCGGVIVQRRLLGNVIRYRVECQGFALHVDALNRGARYLLSEGANVMVHADLEEARIL
ncbi:ABC transporter ATP-binding protein [Chromohalobacter japonicus]|uniref:ABC transporter ATP-binding protein n=1 Tax=Chromohalobacter japonicus TaxID=223900 RepID=UPI0009FA4DA0|nr:ABC transporter ATP-binding protein [Chromohalobacter japonicus]